MAARTERTVAAARQRFGPRTATTTDYRELLARNDVDAVMIGLPRPENVRAATRALEAGKHVWVEPPFAHGPEAERLFDVADSSAAALHVDLELRYLPVVQAVVGLTTRGVLGRPRSVKVELTNDWGRRRGARHMGTVVSGLATWYADLVELFAGGTIEEVELVGSDAMESGTAKLRYSDGLTGEFEFELDGPSTWDLRLKVATAAGEAQADLFTGYYRHRVGDGDWTTGVADCLRPDYGFVGMRESVAAFVSAIRGEQPTMSGPDVYRGLHRTLGEFTFRAIATAT